MLEAKNISKQYNDCILENVSIKIHDKEVVAISGPSGSGKSTLLFMLGQLTKPSSGEIFYKNKNLQELSDKEVSKIRNEDFGFIFQDTQLLNSYSVLENVLLPTEIAGKKGMLKKAKDMLIEFGLKERLDYYPYQLSIGQRRRVSIARALIMEPKIIFADEPTNDLDEKRAVEIEDLLLSLPNRGCAVVLVTHDSRFLKKVPCCYEIDGTHLVKKTLCKSIL